ncbi:MAG: hypothetical protein HQK77_16675 [Desulfobacterales bacterium]|nr:hypothetical protein [Desulfobacterales bacterium]
MRWCDTKRQIIPTGFERAEMERHNAAFEKQRAEMEKQRADRLAEKLKSLGMSLD